MKLYFWFKKKDGKNCISLSLHFITPNMVDLNHFIVSVKNFKLLSSLTNRNLNGSASENCIHIVNLCGQLVFSPGQKKLHTYV